jgi:hypothetical protein
MLLHVLLDVCVHLRMTLIILPAKFRKLPAKD